MKKIHARRLTAAVAAAALIGIPVASAAADPEPAPRPPQAVETLQPQPTSPTAYDFGETLAELEGEKLEITFLAAIIGHHQAAIEMAQLELERGTDPQIRTHAENIIASQQNQVDQFTRWLQEWYGLTPEAAREQAPEEARREMRKMDRETQRDMEELRAVPAGEEFDVAFVRKIIPHHSAGIIEFLEPQSRAVHPELRVAATTGIVSQEAQIADFRTWLAGQAD